MRPVILIETFQYDLPSLLPRDEAERPGANWRTRKALIAKPLDRCRRDWRECALGVARQSGSERLRIVHPHRERVDHVGAGIGAASASNGVPS